MGKAEKNLVDCFVAVHAAMQDLETGLVNKFGKESECWDEFDLAYHRLCLAFTKIRQRHGISYCTRED